MVSSKTFSIEYLFNGYYPPIDGPALIHKWEHYRAPRTRVPRYDTVEISATEGNVIFAHSTFDAFPGMKYQMDSLKQLYITKHFFNPLRVSK